MMLNPVFHFFVFTFSVKPFTFVIGSSLPFYETGSVPSWTFDFRYILFDEFHQELGLSTLKIYILP